MMMRLMNFKAVRVVLLLCALLGGSVSFVAAPAFAQTVSFGQIIVKGNIRIETATIRNFAAIKPGQPVTPGQINAAHQRLKETGLFEKVEITPSGNSLIIAVLEFPSINRINFERNKRIKDDVLAELITSRPRHTYSPAQAEADAAIIVEAYRQSGRYSAEVKPKIIRRADNRVDLVFEIFEGKVVEIQRLSFIGNRQFSDRRLRRILGTKQAGILRRFIKSDTFIADRIEFDKQVLRDFYMSRGFIDIEVISASVEVVRERNGFFITFKVREGQSYKFGEITTSSVLAEIDPDEYQAIIKVKPGVTYSPHHLERTIARMEELATQRGLNFIRVNPRINRNDAERTLDIEFVIERGPRVFVERIDIEGNTTTVDRVIRRQFTTVEGDPFNPREIRAASDRIRALGFFAKTEVQTREGTSPDRVIVDVDVEEQPTGALSFGVVYGGSSGLGANVSLSESNFLGRGQFLKIELGGGIDNANAGVTFAEPAFLDRNLRVELSFFRNTTEQQNAFFDTLKVGFSPKLSFPLSDNGRIQLSYNASSDTVFNVDPGGTGSSALITAGTNTVSSFGGLYTYDTRSTGLNPKAGTFIRVSQEFAGAGGSSKFSKTTALLGARTSIFNGEVGLSAEVEGGALVNFGGASSITDRFFMGQSIMRGFRHNGIGPRDLVAPNMEALGGNFYAVLRLEANFPLGLPEEYGVAGGAFLDVGSLWGLDDTAGGLAGLDPVDDSMILRSVVGFSIFWETAIGPLRFNFTRVLAGPGYDQSEVFNMTVGARF